VTGPMPDDPSDAALTAPEAPTALGPLFARSLLGGLLMGLANLVPGISGGTMLLAAGVYPRFINAIAELTTARFRAQSLVVLGGVGASAVMAILLLAGSVKGLVVDHRWVMYSLFIGLTLGGVPVLWGLVGRRTRDVYLGAAAGFVAMALLAIAQASGAGAATGGTAGIPMFFLAGVAGASAMILPGVSGSYLLLVMGMYVPILTGIDALKEALKAADLSAAMDPMVQVVLPVGVGVLVGVVAVSNVLRVLLSRFEKATLGVLLGMLVGAVVGLYPFQDGRQPVPGDVIKGQVVTVESVADIDADDWPTAFFTPTPGQVGGSLALGVLGLGLTFGVSVLGRGKG
jgi:putative membrane protein